MRKTLLIFLLIFSSLFAVAQDEDKGAVQFLTGYYNDIYSEPYSRNFNVFYAGLGYKTTNSAIYGKVNYGLLIEPKSTGLQFELDYYQRLAKTWTSWWNYAYSNADYFPNHRAMARIWKELPKGFLISGGLKYYYYDTNLFTGSLGLEKYMGRFWVEGLGFIHFKDPDPRFSYQLNSRVFWKDYNFVQLSLTTGAAQDEPWRTGTLPASLNAHSVNLSVCTYIGSQRKFQLRANAGYSYEEYTEDSWRGRYTTGIGVVINIF